MYPVTCVPSSQKIKDNFEHSAPVQNVLLVVETIIFFLRLRPSRLFFACCLTKPGLVLTVKNVRR